MGYTHAQRSLSHRIFLCLEAHRKEWDNVPKEHVVRVLEDVTHAIRIQQTGQDHEPHDR